MMYLNRCIITARKSYSSLAFLKKSVLLKHHVVPTRTFINKWKFQFPKSKPKPDPNKDKREEEIILTSIDDPNFSKALLQAMLNPDFEKSFSRISSEVDKLSDEVKAEIDKTNYRIDEAKGRIDMLYTFDKEDDLKNFQVHTDSSFLQGYSSASLKMTQEETALFSGIICTEVPKDGNVRIAGYANFSSIIHKKAFGRTKFLDWTSYTHIVLKVRGDGRTYVILINIHGDYDEAKYQAYMHPLHTRGGPYWQISRIPLSHFYLTMKGKICFDQNTTMMLTQIRTVGISAVGFDGPFRLEIDYIGLEYDEFHKNDCPYEAYR